MWIANSHSQWRGWLLCVCLLFSTSVWAVTNGSTKNWGTVIFTGSLSKDKNILYYLQPQITFKDDKYKFHSSFLFIGAGYQILPTLSIWLMDGYYYIQNSNSTLTHQNVLRQQVNYNLMNTDESTLISTSRLEERKHLSETQWNVRLRQRETLRIPFKQWAYHSFVLFDEMFFNFNYPKWVNSNSVLEQNRVFIGIGTTLTKTIAFDIGYLNQYQIKKVNEMSDVLYLAFTVQGD